MKVLLSLSKTVALFNLLDTSLCSYFHMSVCLDPCSYQGVPFITKAKHRKEWVLLIVFILNLLKSFSMLPGRSRSPLNPHTQKVFFRSQELCRYLACAAFCLVYYCESAEKMALSHPKIQMGK